MSPTLHLYATYLNPPNYIIDSTTQDIVYVATSPADEDVDFPEVFPYPFGTN